jgi:hypothetical protein
MAGGQRLINWLHPCSTSNVALNTHTSTHGPHMGHPNWAGCDKLTIVVNEAGPRVSVSKQTVRGCSKFPTCHTRFSEENQVHTYMHARIKFHAYSDI